jgi:hypothetical protein
MLLALGTEDKRMITTEDTENGFHFFEINATSQGIISWGGQVHRHIVSVPPVYSMVNLALD